MVDVWRQLRAHAQAVLDIADRAVTEGVTNELLVALEHTAAKLPPAAAAVRRATWQRLRQQGWSLADIAAEAGVTPQAVSQALKRGAAAAGGGDEDVTPHER